MSSDHFIHVLLGVLRGTPIWVYILFAYLLGTGLQQLQPRERPLLRVLLVPLLFIAWGLIGLFSRAVPASQIAACWLAGAGIGVLVAARLRLPMTIDRGRGLVWQAGSVVPLVRNMSLFLSHYFLHVAAAIHPQSSQLFTAADIVVSGFSAGYFIAWSLRFARVYAQSAGTDPVPQDNGVATPVR